MQMPLPWLQHKGTLHANHSAAPAPQNIALLHTIRLAGAVTDPYKQGQYTNLIKALQEEQQILKEMEQTLNSLKSCGAGGQAVSSGGLGSRVGSSSVVRAFLGFHECKLWVLLLFDYCYASCGCTAAG